MESWDMVVNFFRQGGVFLYPIALIWVVGIVIAIERFIELTRAAHGNRRLWDELQPMFESGRFREAMTRVTNSDSALGHVMRYGMSRISSARRREDIEKAMEESLIEVIPKLEKRTHYLATLANIGMLMGLLGTVMGIIKAFNAIYEGGMGDPRLLSGGISEALITTAAGLSVAIHSYIAYRYLRGRVDRIVLQMERDVVRFADALNDRAEQSRGDEA